MKISRRRIAGRRDRGKKQTNKQSRERHREIEKEVAKTPSERERDIPPLPPPPSPPPQHKFKKELIESACQTKLSVSLSLSLCPFPFLPRWRRWKAMPISITWSTKKKTIASPLSRGPVFFGWTTYDCAGSLEWNNLGFVSFRLPVGEATVIIWNVPLLFCIICMNLYRRPLGLFSSTGGCGIFDVCNDPNACWAGELVS